MNVVIDKKDYLRDWRARSQQYLMYTGAKCRAKRKNMEFTISKEDIIIPTHCPVLGMPIQRNIGSGFHNNSPSLDRIDNTQGYTKDNIRVISNRANLLKCDATLEELELLLKDAYSLRY